ncbi:MAG: hypothetical protein JWR38_4556 [Mucilaginibacter sp.]|nr:hypothetical protein [Mucilaginibacter sp.]
MPYCNIALHINKHLLLLLLLLTTSIALKAQNSLPTASALPEDVGDIVFDPKTDKANFYLCHQNFIIQYYNVATSYKGGGGAIKKSILNRYRYKQAYMLATGFVTIRFVINCKGQTDRFRISQLNNNYQQTVFNKDLIAQLLELCKSLDQWVPGKDDKGNIYDSYYYLNFKLVKGHIKAITP